MKKFVLIIAVSVVFLMYFLSKEESFLFHKSFIKSESTSTKSLIDQKDEQSLDFNKIKEVELAHKNLNDDAEKIEKNFINENAESKTFFMKNVFFEEHKINLKSVQNLNSTVKTFLEFVKKMTTSKQQSGELKKRFPQAIIAGVKKCGTRALLSFLGKHPNVRSAGKEIHFFDKDDRYKLGLESYLDEMPLSYENELTIEKTPGYFISPYAPERIFKLSPSIKLIFIFRDPVERAISDYAQTLAKSDEEVKEIEKRVFIEGSFQKTVNKNSSLIKIGLYAEHLQRWLKVFPMKQMYFANGDEFIKNPGIEMQEIQKFLNIPTVINENSFVFNKTKGFYCLRIKEKEEEREDCLGETKGRKHPYVKKSTKIKLRAFFKSYNKQFFNLINKNFGWTT